jgi:soluble lytic murein transglycosylase-like protein
MVGRAAGGSLVRVLRSLASLACLAALGLGASAAYTVRTGDTLSGIATRLGVEVRDLAAANGIKDPNQVVAGRALKVPGSPGTTPAASAPRTHVVGAGDNLTTIGRRYGVSVGALASANHLDPRKVLLLGARLEVPGAAAVPTSGYPSRLLRAPERIALIPVFKRWAAANALPVDLVMATTWLESGWQNTVVSPVGAVGIGQLMPDTVRFVRGELIGIPTLDPRIPEHNIRMSTRYLRWLIDQTNGDVRLALSGYYQGLRSVRTNGSYPGTVAYVDGVLSLRPRFLA